MIEVLRLLDQEGLFATGAEREKITLFVTISDDDGSVDLENKSAKVLNPPSVFDRFIKRYDWRPWLRGIRARWPRTSAANSRWLHESGGN
ncbi:DUF4303 domain-containing protein [Burkholderia multivorans]|uniref:DUF4303 domain-containing protein n=1 Tax=Burkholderia multivorans TaxID=87883 RepID=UPI0020B17D96|nr:DUF4303 domain-containing protein [Burkholderia multivorans]